MEKKLKKSIILISLIIFCFVLNSTVFAAGGYTWTGFSAEETNIGGAGGDMAGAGAKAKNILGTGIQVLRVAGTGISIIMLSYMGIKYMTAAPSEKAEFKKSATAYVVGAIILFAASNIIAIIAKFATSNITTT